MAARVLWPVCCWSVRVQLMHRFVTLVQSVHVCPVTAYSEYIIVFFVQFFHPVSLGLVTVVAYQYVGISLLGHLSRSDSGVESLKSVGQ